MRRLRYLPSIQNLILLAMLAIAGASADAFAPAGIAAWLLPLALAGGLLGLALGLMRTADSLAHLMAIGLGFGATLALAAMRMAEEAPGASFRERFVSVAAELRDWYVGTGSRESTTNLLVIVLLQLIVWLGSYLAGWTLARQGWVGIAILLPGSVVFAARVAADGAPPRALELYIVLAIVLLARMTWVRRLGGRSAGSTAARGAGSLLTAAVVAVLVVSLGVSTPDDFSQRALEPLAQQAADTYLSAQTRTADWLSEHTGLMGDRAPGVDDFPRYTAFDDAFSIGGNLNLSPQPEVLVRTGGPAPYLSAQSYDTYTGRGWESTVEDTFNANGPDGVRYAPELTFRPEQRVPYSPAVRENRAEVTMQVTPLGPPADIVFADGEYLTASERASVRMSWRQMQGERFPLREMDLASLPPDLTGIAGMLMASPELTVEGDAGLLYPPTAEARDRLQQARAQLGDRFIDVSWSVAADGRVEAMFVTGQLPVYDDNVTVERATDRRVGQPYQVTSLASTATEDQLRAATTDYPAWVTARYLPLPDTVTDRTVELTRSITAGTATPFDQARAIEAYLREHITYDIAVGVPAKGLDIVDYVLFENPRGYCEHYASAMTVMLRILGIPARTVVGYYPGEWDAASGGYLYRQTNAHAWTEAFFPGYGWIRFEPTASQPSSEFDGTVPTALPEQALATPAAPEAPVQPDTPEVPASPSTDQTPPPVAEAVPEPPGGGGSVPWALIGGAVAAATAALGLGAWLFSRRAPAATSGALFSTMVRWGRAGGVAGGAVVTPREYARRVGRRYPDLANDARRIVEVYEDERYGGHAPEGGRLRQAAEALANVRRAVIRRIARLGR
jgi:transglutaminase-like putative cysteine protease